MKTRPRFRCCACDRIFGQVVDLEGNPVLLLECPYCKAECKVDLTPFRHRILTVTRGLQRETDAQRVELPEIVPTATRGDEGA